MYRQSVFAALPPNQMLALMIMYGKTPARSKVRNMFDMFDLDRDGRLNSSETILMLRSATIPFGGTGQPSCQIYSSGAGISICDRSDKVGS